MNKSKNGITLIALIVTVIVLLILAAVTINMVLGENGIFSKTKMSIEKYKEATLLEETRLALVELQMEMLTDKTVNASNMADYVIQKNGVAVGNGQVYEDEGEFFYENNNGEKVQLINNEGKLKIDKIVNKEELSITGRVMYHANGGTGNLPSSSRVVYGQQVIVDTETTPTRENCNFLGWALESDATTPITEFTMPEKNVTLYAVWEKIITITYNANGGSGTMTSTTGTAPKVATNTYTAPTNKQFKEWNTQADGEGTAYAVDTTATDNLNLYAIWTGIPVTGISLNKTSTTLNIGGTENLIATILPENAENKGVTWSTSNSSIATVENGVVTAVASGSVTITAASQGDTSKAATCTVTVGTPNGSVNVTQSTYNFTVPLGINCVYIVPSGYQVFCLDSGKEWTYTYVEDGGTGEGWDWPDAYEEVADVYVAVTPGKTYRLSGKNYTISWGTNIENYYRRWGSDEQDL